MATTPTDTNNASYYAWGHSKSNSLYISEMHDKQVNINTGHFIMFSVITNIDNKKTKGPTLMELFTATGKLRVFFFVQLEMFDVCTTGDTAHIDTILKFLPHTHMSTC